MTGRLDPDKDELFRKINSSIDFDRRLAPYDILQSQAHARALHSLGVLDDEELSALSEGLSRIQADIDAGTFVYEDSDEDIHMAIERRLVSDLGPLGGKLHTARSRNDQVATDLSLFVRAHSLACIDLTAGLMEVLLGLARDHQDWRSPAYTHLQRAQPVYLSHHLLAYFWSFGRDAFRFRVAYEAAGEMPAGSGALAGLNWDLDREGMAELLGFDGPTRNSLDSVSSRDQALDLLSAAAVCSMHLSRLGSEVVLWSSSEFGFVTAADDFSSGSSIMPQKKNPDAAELLRAKSPRVTGNLTALLGTLHGLPLGYSKDMQEDKEALFDAVDTTETSLQAATRMLEGMEFDRERLEAAAADPLLAATDLADLLVAEGMPFRDAHKVVGHLVRRSLAEETPFEGLIPEGLESLDPEARSRVEEAMRSRDVIEAKVSYGGTSSGRIEEQIAAAADRLTAVRSLLVP